MMKTKAIWYASILAGMVNLSHALEYNGIDIHGFASQGYLKSSNVNYLGDSKDGTTDFREFGINAGGRITNDLKAGAQLFLYETGVYGGMEPEIDWAYLDYSPSDLFGIRAGRVKLPIGLHNEYLDLDFVRPFVLLPQGIYDARFRSFLTAINGVSIYGNIPLGDISSLDYQVFGGYLSLDGDMGAADFYEAKTFMKVNDMEVQDMIGIWASWNTPLDGLKLGFSLSYFRDYELQGNIKTREAMLLDKGLAYPLALPNPLLGGATAADVLNQAPTTLSTDRFDIWTVFAEYTWMDLVFNAEYMERNATLYFATDHPFAGAISPALVGIEPRYTDQASHYFSLSYQLTDKIQLGTYYNHFQNKRSDRTDAHGIYPGDPEHLGWQNDIAISVRYDFTFNWLVKLEYHKYEGSGLVFNLDGTNPTESRDQDWGMFAVKTTFFF